MSILKKKQQLTNVKICFTSTYIGSKEYLEISHGFKKVKNARYFFFTNLKNIKNHYPWEIVHINLNDFKHIGDVVKISRYFKFKGYKYLQKKLFINPDFIFYCDCYYFPKPEINWNNICNIIKDRGIIQYEHKRSKGGIKVDLFHLAKKQRDTVKNIKDTEKFFYKIDPKIKLDYPQYFLNGRIGIYIKNEKLRKIINQFWKYYLKSPTYRDQPLLNFIYLRNNFRPAIFNKSIEYFGGKEIFKKYLRKVKDYKNSNQCLDKKD